MANGLSFIPTSSMSSLVEGQKKLFPAATAATTAPATGGRKGFDPEKLKALAPALGILAAALVSPKGYRGIGAGSAAEMMNLLAQQEEERKRYAKEQERQAWMDEMTRLDWEQRQKELAQQRELAQWLGGKLMGMGEYVPGSPGGYEVVETPAAIPGLTLGGDFTATFGGQGREAQPSPAARRDAFTLAPAPEFDVVSTPATPAKAGDPMARMWGEFVTQSGGAPWAIQGALQYYQASQMPQGEKRVKTLFGSFSKNNKSAVYALENYDSLSNEELDKWYEAAIKEEADLRGESLEREKMRLDAAKKTGGDGTDEFDPTKTYRGTPYVQQWNQKYEKYRQMVYDDGGTPLPLEKWMRGQKKGDDLWAQYVAESDIYGDPFYKTPAGMLVAKYGSLETAYSEAIKQGKPVSVVKDLAGRAIINAIKNNKPEKAIQMLIDRYNKIDPKARPSTIGEWRQYAASQG